MAEFPVFEYEQASQSDVCFKNLPTVDKKSLPVFEAKSNSCCGMVKLLFVQDGKPNKLYENGSPEKWPEYQMCVNLNIDDDANYELIVSKRITSQLLHNGKETYTFKLAESVAFPHPHYAHLFLFNPRSSQINLVVCVPSSIIRMNWVESLNHLISVSTERERILSTLREEQDVEQLDVSVKSGQANDGVGEYKASSHSDEKLESSPEKVDNLIRNISDSSGNGSGSGVTELEEATTPVFSLSEIGNINSVTRAGSTSPGVPHQPETETTAGVANSLTVPSMPTTQLGSINSNSNSSTYQPSVATSSDQAIGTAEQESYNLGNNGTNLMDPYMEHSVPIRNIGNSGNTPAAVGQQIAHVSQPDQHIEDANANVNVVDAENGLTASTAAADDGAADGVTANVATTAHDNGDVTDGTKVAAASALHNEDEVDYVGSGTEITGVDGDEVEDALLTAAVMIPGIAGNVAVPGLFATLFYFPLLMLATSSFLLLSWWLKLLVMSARWCLYLPGKVLYDTPTHLLRAFRAVLVLALYVIGVALAKVLTIFTTEQVKV